MPINRKWIIDPFRGKHYNSFCAFEMALINLGIIKYDMQSGIDELDEYLEKYELSTKINI